MQKHFWVMGSGLSEPGFTGFKDFQDYREDESTPNARVASQ